LSSRNRDLLLAVLDQRQADARKKKKERKKLNETIKKIVK